MAVRFPNQMRYQTALRSVAFFGFDFPREFGLRTQGGKAKKSVKAEQSGTKSHQTVRKSHHFHTTGSFFVPTGNGGSL